MMVGAIGSLHPYLGKSPPPSNDLSVDVHLFIIVGTANDPPQQEKRNKWRRLRGVCVCLSGIVGLETKSRRLQFQSHLFLGLYEKIRFEGPFLLKS